jgi:hypothetical protein
MIPVWHTDTSAICPSTSLCSLCEVAATGVSKCASSSRGLAPTARVKAERRRSVVGQPRARKG